MCGGFGALHSTEHLAWATCRRCPLSTQYRDWEQVGSTEDVREALAAVFAAFKAKEALHGSKEAVLERHRSITMRALHLEKCTP